ncbi:MAG: RluA family pseudouridine synthase, partial [Caulobacteraceae bacterium]|nr:RluA family pseudouridine synthase [Caulobacteraceae bacterium]
VVYEDDDMLVLNKPAGLAVQGGSGTHRHIDRLLAAWGEGLDRPRLVHRLDRDTSGVLVLGKGPGAAARLAEAFACREALKTYWAIVHGAPAAERGVIDRPMGKVVARGRERVSIRASQVKDAISLYAILASSGGASFMALRPLTGRTHQLRVHMLGIGHPILGDPKYNSPVSRAFSDSLALQLHARALTVRHPSGKLMRFKAPIGPELAAGLDRFGFDPGSAPSEPFDLSAT